MCSRIPAHTLESWRIGKNTPELSWFSFLRLKKIFFHLGRLEIQRKALLVPPQLKFA
jgi:hypothetical protein